MVRSSHQSCSLKKAFLKISQNWQENTCARAFSLIKLRALNGQSLSSTLWENQETYISRFCYVIKNLCWIIVPKCSYYYNKSIRMTNPIVIWKVTFLFSRESSCNCDPVENNFLIMRSLIHIMPLVSLYNSLKHQKTNGTNCFLIFFGGKQRHKWHEIDQFEQQTLQIEKLELNDTDCV